MLNKLRGPIFATLTLGMAPFVPEPHFFGKVRWVLGGAVGMQPMDWLDLIFHGIPWLWLTITVTLVIVKQLKHVQQKV